MNKRKAIARLSSIVFLVPVLCCAAVQAEPQPEPRGWQRDAALSLSKSVDSSEQLRQLLSLTVSGNTPEVLDSLQFIRHRDDWPMPARDHAIHTYTQQLRSLPAHAVAPEVLVWLESYQPLAWINHEDHAHGLVPMFNIRASAVGVQNSWRRQEGILEGLALLNSAPRSLADAWLIDPHPATRAGYLQALQQASRPQLRALAKHAVHRANRQPELAALAGHAALQLHDVQTFGHAIIRGGDADAARLLRTAGKTFSASDNALLLRKLMRKASDSTASLAIAQLYPVSSEQSRQLLINHLANPALGATAALALASDPDPALQAELKALGKSKNSLVAHRARNAMEANEPVRGQ